MRSIKDGLQVVAVDAATQALVAGTHYAILHSAQFSTLWLAAYTSTAEDPGRHLYPPGPCCSPAERATVAVLSEQPWYSSVVTIAYPAPR